MVLCLFLGTMAFLFSWAAACFDEQYKAGQWIDLGAGVALLTLFPVLGVICCTLAVALLRRRVYRVFAWSALVAAFVMGSPATALPLARMMSGPASDLLWLPMKEAADKREHERTVSGRNWMGPREIAIRRHYDALTVQFGQPQQVSRGDSGFILLENHEIVRLHGVYQSPETTADLMRYVNEHLAGRRVTLRLPDRETFETIYSPGAASVPPGYKPEFFGLSPLDGSGYRYGTIPCLVYVDGVLLNARYKGTRGSLADFGEYEKAPAR